jgi:DNA repair exonuclease SbcCD nuclease subunit
VRQEVNDSPVCGIFTADIHWTETPPISRSKTDTWLGYQEWYWRQVTGLQQRHKQAPIFIAGDVFNRWNVSHQLVNHVINWMKGSLVYAIPGNHDTPEHAYNQLGRSAYWTLVEAGVLNHLSPGAPHAINELEVHAYPHGFVVKPLPEPGNGLMLRVALIHDFIWTEKTGYEGAPVSNRFGAWRKRLVGYDVAVFGDNHKGFMIDKEGQVVYNCGSFMARHSDERSYKPRVGILRTDGSMSHHYLDTSKDLWIDPHEDVKRLESALLLDLSQFAEELSNLHADRVDFVKECVRWIDNSTTSDMVRRMLYKALGVKYGKRS